MQRQRIVSVVQDTWGCAIVFGDEQDPSKPDDDLGDDIISLPTVLFQRKNLLRYPACMKLTFFQASLFAEVLEDAISQLRILEECNNPIRVDKAMYDMLLLLAKKYEVPKKTIGDDLDDINPKKLHCIEYKLQKLEDDRKYLEKVLSATYLDLSLGRRFRYLRDHVRETIDRYNSRQKLIQDESANRILRRELNRQIRHQRNHIKSVYYETQVVLEGLMTEVEDASLNANIRRRYVDNWQKARTEQHKQRIQDKESTPLDNIMLYKQRSDQEHRVHSEVELLINLCINETLEKVEQWMNKYDKDMEAIDLKIQRKKNQYEDMLIKNENLEKTIEEHKKSSENWVQFKEEREKARLYREKMNEAAICIQAWWRGLLVRNQLGPYKIVKKKPPPTPEAGKKKKK